MMQLIAPACITNTRSNVSYSLSQEIWDEGVTHSANVLKGFAKEPKRAGLRAEHPSDFTEYQSPPNNYSTV
jgi:hypothetical protein